ncbi:MAG: molecular chaperone DnaJ [Candidatus Paceibacterota bacterium]|jgi:molecular chaperone DnaJ
MASTKDYYNILGVEKNASEADIKKAFHKLAHKYHPDKSGGDDTKFKEVSEAYQVLSDAKKRKEYDTYGQTFGEGGPRPGGAGYGGGFEGFDFSNFTQGFGGGQSGYEEMDFGDIFGDFFGGGRQRQGRARGKDISIDLQISFSESIFGTERDVLLHKLNTCTNCKGSGAKPGTKKKKCEKCNGAGRIREARKSFLGQIMTERECTECRGTGEIPEEHCGECRGLGVVKRNETIKIKIPSGIQNGEMIRMTGAGEAVSHGTTGDLYIKIHVEASKQFRREGQNLQMDLEIKLTDALLGAVYPVKTLDGEIKLTIPTGATFGEILRVRGKGVPIEHSGGRGDLLIHLIIKLPSKVSKKASELIKELKGEGL